MISSFLILYYTTYLIHPTPSSAACFCTYALPPPFSICYPLYPSLLLLYPLSALPTVFCLLPTVICFRASGLSLFRAFFGYNLASSWYN
jgi:hypothetical protein